MKKVVTVAALTLMAALLIAGCGPRVRTPSRLVLSVHIAGDLASVGLPTVKAAELVAAEWNERGGIMGKQIELVVEDDVCKPEVAGNSAAKVVGKGVVAVIGHICSGATKSALGIYSEAGIPAISPGSTSPPLTKSGEYGNFFRTIAPDDLQAQTDAEFIADYLKLSRMAVLHDKQDYGKGFAEFSVEFLENLGVEIALYEGITAGAVDYPAILTRIANSDAEGILYGRYYPEASKLVQQMSQMGLDIPFVSDDGVQTDTFVKVAGEYAEGVYASGPRDTSSNPMYAVAAEEHKKVLWRGARNVLHQRVRSRRSPHDGHCQCRKHRR